MGIEFVESRSYCPEGDHFVDLALLEEGVLNEGFLQEVFSRKIF